MGQALHNKHFIRVILTVGLMLFALFFGAGNLIFPASLGQQAGAQLIPAMLGFLMTGVGLPLLGIMAMSYSGEGDVRGLAARVHPVFGLIFAIALYLTIGPIFALPRTATVAYEIGIVPLSRGLNVGEPIILAAFTLAFFAVSFWLAISPNRLVDRIGTILTPILLTSILILVGFSVVQPMGGWQSPMPKYEQVPLVTGFLQGYDTMDAFAAFVFGVIVIRAIEQKTQGYKTMRLTMLSALVAAVALAVVYAMIGYLGATSVETLGYLQNGAEVLAQSSQHYLGVTGNFLLALIVLLACQTTSVGLIVAFASFFHSLMPKVSYLFWVIATTAFACLVANWGLDALIKWATPVLLILYPLTVVLLILTFVNDFFAGQQVVYVTTMLFTFPIGVLDAYKTVFGLPKQLTYYLAHYLPFYSIGLGWLLPSLVGFIVGMLMTFIWKRRQPVSNSS